MVEEDISTVSGSLFFFELPDLGFSMFDHSMFGLKNNNKYAIIIYSYRGEHFFFGNYTIMADYDLRNSTLESKAFFGPYPLIKCKTHQIWPTLK